MVLCWSSTGWVTTNSDVGTVGSSGTVKVEPTTSENGEVHAVVESPSTACAAVDPGSPVRRRFDVAVTTPARPLSVASDARSLRRRVNVGVRSRADPNVKSRTRRGSGSLRQRLSGSVRSRVSTMASGVSAATPAVSDGTVDHFVVRAEPELGEPDRRRTGVGAARPGCDAGDRDPDELRAGRHVDVLAGVVQRRIVEVDHL